MSYLAHLSTDTTVLCLMKWPSEELQDLSYIGKWNVKVYVEIKVEKKIPGFSIWKNVAFEVFYYVISSSINFFI